MNIYIQYATYLISGTFYYLMLAAIMGVAAAISFWAFPLIFSAIILGSVAPGLSLTTKHLGSLLGGLIGLIFFVYITIVLFTESVEGWKLVAFIPAIATVFVSVINVLKPQAKNWKSIHSTTKKIIFSLLILCPAVIGIWIVIEIFTNLFFR